MLWEEPACPNCHVLGEFSDIYDKFFCKKCDIWLDPHDCGNPDCEFCPAPDKPSLAGELIRTNIDDQLEETAKGIY